MSGPIAALVLSAGSSRRMGIPKALVMLAGRTLAERCVDAAIDAGAEPVLVVVGAEVAGIGGSLRSRPVEVVENPRWTDGLSSSIRCGIEAIVAREPQVEAVLLIAVDQPLVTSEHLGTLLRRWRETGAAVVASAYDGTLGIPAVFGQEMFAEIRSLAGDRGARDLIRGPGHHVEEVPCPAAAHDVDTPEDLAVVAAMLER